MRTFEILLPQRDNQGEPQRARICDWLGEALAIAGGFTILTDDARGAWAASDEKTMLDNSSVIRVATTAANWRRLVAAFWRHFPDQVSVMWTDLGESMIELRSDRASAPVPLRDRFEASADDIGGNWLNDGAHSVKV